MKLSIIIPVYNEGHLIDKIITKVKQVSLPADITREFIIINDGSTDNTGDKLANYNSDPEIRIFNTNKNLGKTNAIKIGFEKLTGDIIIIQDADLEYDPDDYPRLIDPIIKGKASVVYGSRFKGQSEKMKIVNRVANILSNITANLLFNAELSDINTCYKVFKCSALEGIKITSKDFMFETEITVKFLKKGYKIYEVPIRYTARTKKEGKKINWFKAIKMYWGMIKYRYSVS